MFTLLYITAKPDSKKKERGYNHANARGQSCSSDEHKLRCIHHHVETVCCVTVGCLNRNNVASFEIKVAFVLK
jgi:hypothetical protein